MAKHDAPSYSKFRPLYPAATFDRVLQCLSPSLDRPPRILDVGCGTGQSTFSFLSAWPHSYWLQAVDPDPEMIRLAKEQLQALQLTSGECFFQVAPAEVLPFADSTFDAVLVLSAYHWFERPRVDAELLRVLTPSGTLMIAEYQFPSCAQLPELTAWIKKGFHENWRFENQTRRGSLRELTRNLTQHPNIEHFEYFRLPMTLSLTPKALSGLLLSQARVIAGLERIPAGSERETEMKRIHDQIAGLMQNSEHDFDFHLSGLILKKTSFPAPSV
jgi:ubiquinone/menaquinone biosynthesis C-methylase UbiE